MNKQIDNLRLGKLILKKDYELLTSRWEGIEPPNLVLKTKVLPLNYHPKKPR